jgi:hypothetical protein
MLKTKFCYETVLSYLCVWFLLLFVLADLGFELRALCLLDRCSIT